MPIHLTTAWNSGERIINGVIALLPNVVLAVVIFIIFLVLASISKSMNEPFHLGEAVEILVWVSALLEFLVAVVFVFQWRAMVASLAARSRVRVLTPLCPVWAAAGLDWRRARSFARRRAMAGTNNAPSQ